jgi:hypothetical protein
MKNNPFDAAKETLGDVEVTYSNTELQKANAISEGIRLLQNMRDIFAISDFTGEQIILLTKTRIVGEWWGIKEYKDICEMLAIMQLSKNRQSRKEIVQVLIGLAAKKNLAEKAKDKIKGEGD